MRKHTTDTIHAALADVVRRRQRLSILGLRPGIDLTDLDAMRAYRFAEDRAPYGSVPDDRIAALTAQRTRRVGPPRGAAATS